jgi:hypothetical protein
MQRPAAKRHHHPGKSGQRHRDLSGGCKRFSWFHRFRLDRIQSAQTNTKFGQRAAFGRFVQLMIWRPLCRARKISQFNVSTNHEGEA